MRESAITLPVLEERLAAEFPEAFGPTGLTIRRIWHGGCEMRQAFRPASLRPGGTLSGVTMMQLADVAMYVAVLASIGWVPLAVTTSLNINFLRRPSPQALAAECRLIKLGKRLAVGEIAIRSEGETELVAHATSTYSIPDRTAG
jgi:uncharacterized protein (TIGR00369 family)